MTDNYTGHVEPGATTTRRLPGLAATKLSVGPMDNNAYLLTCAATGAAVLIDAADDAERLLAAVAGVDLRAIVTTHRHQDHWQALAEVAATTGAPVAAHPADAGALPVPVTIELTDGAVLPFGDRSLTAIHLVGHTPGSVALLLDGGGHLFTGDSLFPGGPGKTWSAADFASLLADLEAKVFGALPDDTWFYPGHGDDSTLGAERPSLPEWRARGW